MRTKTATAIAAITIQQPVHAAEYYVSPDGNDAFSGTKEKPFKTVEAAQGYPQWQYSRTSR